MTKAIFIDALTNQTTERNLTAEEINVLRETEEENKNRLNMEAKANRHSAFIQEADPLYFASRRGEVHEQVWLDKVAEIRARYPYRT